MIVKHTFICTREKEKSETLIHSNVKQANTNFDPVKAQLVLGDGGIHKIITFC